MSFFFKLTTLSVIDLSLLLRHRSASKVNLNYTTIVSRLPKRRCMMRALSNFLSYLRKFPIRSAPKILTALSRLSGTPFAPKR